MNYRHSGCGLCQNHWAQVAARSPLHFIPDSPCPLPVRTLTKPNRNQRARETVCKDETWTTEQS